LPWKSCVPADSNSASFPTGTNAYPLLRQLNLERFFQTIVVSCEVGQCKPSAAIFRQAAQKLELRPCEILHIGDSPTFDIAGATAADLQALLLSRDEDPKPGQLNSLLALSAVLRQ